MYLQNKFTFNLILFSGTLREFSEDYIVHNTNNSYKFKCKLCEKEFTTRQKIENHIESIHFPGFFVYTCVSCNTSVNTRQKYYHHINKFHSRRDSQKHIIMSFSQFKPLKAELYLMDLGKLNLSSIVSNIHVSFQFRVLVMQLAFKGNKIKLK